MTIEELVEIERKKIEDLANKTPVNEETFASWKKKEAELAIKEEKELWGRLNKMNKKERAVAVDEYGRPYPSGPKKKTGKELFMENRELFVDDEGAADDDVMNDRVEAELTSAAAQLNIVDEELFEELIDDEDLDDI